MQLQEQQAFVGGEWREAADGRQFVVLNPANGAQLGMVADCGAADAQQALDAAAVAFASWRKTTAAERSAVLRKWAGLMLERQEELARLLTAEQGKPLAEARGEVAYAAGFLTWFAEEGRRSHGGVVPPHRNDARIVVMKEPVGVVAAVTPWNFPLAMITRKIGPALAAGCAIIIKPAEDTPLSALALARLGQEAGVPSGVVSVVTTKTPADVVGVWMASPVVRKFSFTGSTATGKLLMRQCADTVKRVSLELGGNAPLIVFDDADIELAVRGTIASKFRNTGQTCVCANRILVEDGIYDRYAAALAKAVADMKVADGTEDGVLQGPLINAPALAKVERHVADAVEKGAQVLTGGRNHAHGGLFYEPTVLSGVTPHMALAHEETFGPVAGLFRFRGEDEAIALANATETGLSAYFFTQDIARAWRVAAALEAGMVGINEGVISTEVAPFGGIKQSGLGREGASEGLDEYLESKYVLFGGLAVK